MGVTIECPDCRHEHAGSLIEAGDPCIVCGARVLARVSLIADGAGASVTGDDVRRLMHTLGVRGLDRRRWGYRNHYAPGKCDEASMHRLVAAGLMVSGAPYRETRFHHATPLAGRLLGFGRVLMRRTFEAA